jgi:hypothetical protein
MIFLQTIGEVPETVSPKLKVFAKKLKKSPGIPTLRRLPCVDMHEIMGVEEPEEPEEINSLQEQFEARDDFQEVWGWEFFSIPGLAYEARRRRIYRNTEGRHIDVLGPADYKFEDILFMEDASREGALVEPPKLFPLVRSKSLREIHDLWVAQFAQFLFDTFGEPEDWANDTGPTTPSLDENEMEYIMQRLNVHRHIAQVAMAKFKPHPKHLCPCGSNKLYGQCCRPAMENFHVSSCLELYSTAKDMRLSRPDDEEYDFLDEFLEESREAGYEELLEILDAEPEDFAENRTPLTSIQNQPQ